MKNMVMLGAVLVLLCVPLLIHHAAPQAAAFAGADEQATTLIGKINPGYIRWARPLWEPPSDEVATLLFSLQAALGAGFLGYYLGLAKGRAQKANEKRCT